MAKKLADLTTETDPPALGDQVVVIDVSDTGVDAGGAVNKMTVRNLRSELINAIGSTGGGTQDIDLSLGHAVSCTVDTSTNTFTFSNPTVTGTYCIFNLKITNGGSQTVVWPASVDWIAATAPTLTAAGVDELIFTTDDGGTIWRGYVIGLDVR